jgi:predicted nuclease of predicted toxin-antitoxin system
MEFLADQDVYASAVRFLIQLGHDVVQAAEVGLGRAEDTEMLRVARQRGRLFATRDRDFGGIVFLQGGGPGVIYLRMLPSTQAAVHAERGRVLTLYSQSDLRGAFVVVEPGRHRIRKAPLIKPPRT